MSIGRWLAAIFLILLLGYLSAFGVFADGSVGEKLVLLLIYLAGSGFVAFLLPHRWQLAGFCGWGAFLFMSLELGARLARGGVDGQQALPQVLLVGFGAVVLALGAGYVGQWVQQRRQAASVK